MAYGRCSEKGFPSPSLSAPAFDVIYFSRCTLLSPLCLEPAADFGMLPLRILTVASVTLLRGVSEKHSQNHMKTCLFQTGTGVTSHISLTSLLSLHGEQAGACGPHICHLFPFWFPLKPPEG